MNIGFRGLASMNMLAWMLAWTLAFSTPARATIRQEVNYVNPATACQAVLTGDAEIRVKATGVRNESTTKNAYVICGYAKPSIDGGIANIRKLDIGFASLDSKDHYFDCTAVTGIGSKDAIYATRHVAAFAAGDYSSWVWTPGDWGSADDYIPYGFQPSITCLLPPQTAIVYTLDWYDLDIGN